MNAIPPSFIADPAHAATQWSALTEAAGVVATLAGFDAQRIESAGDDLPALLRDARGWRRELAGNGVTDLAAIMEPGIAALLAINARGADPRPAARALWREYRAAREAILALLPPGRCGANTARRARRSWRCCRPAPDRRDPRPRGVDFAARMPRTGAMQSPPQSRILDAVAALKELDRERAARLLEEELRLGPPSGDRWKSVARLAGQIGEIDIAIEAARRYAGTAPQTLDRLLYYWSELAGYDRVEEARRETRKLPAALRRHLGVLHFLGTLAGQQGDFAAAETCYRDVLAQSRLVPQTWFALAMIKTFAPGDPDLAEMERLLPAIEGGGMAPATVARFLHGLAKARHDCGDHDRAFALYSQGAALRRRDEKWDPASLERHADELIRDFTAGNVARLRPPANVRPALFVNGLPRSGTTLVEQILVSHSQVAEGGEINLLRPALIPTGDRSLAGARRYEQRMAGHPDPWGELARDYFRMLEMRFRTDELVVDKTLNQSHFMGLLLHMLPGARVIWMRRDPEDAALSCFRTFFSSPLPWSWSLEDIGRYFAIEDKLFEHWTREFPERILAVPYESLARAPDEWIPRILAHAGLPDEPQVREFHATRRSVRTASVQQVRAPITTARIGQAQAYAAHLAPFRKAYGKA